MVRKLLLYGMLVGLAAGLLAFVVAKTIGEPQVDKAIAFEGLVAQSHHEAEGAELVSRTVQNTVGLGAGVIVYGVAFGGIFALVFALGLRPTRRPHRPRARPPRSGSSASSPCTWCRSSSTRRRRPPSGTRTRSDGGRRCTC